MGYVGVPPQSGFITTAKQRVTSSTNNYVDLDHSISSLSDVIVWINFVKQDSTNLTLTTSTRITLGGTLVSSDIVEIAYLGKAVATQTPDTGTVSLDMLSASGTKDATTFLRGDNTFASAGADADNYFATSGLSSKDLGVGLHIKTNDTGGTVSGDADELVLEGSAEAGLTILGTNSNRIFFGDASSPAIGWLRYFHNDNHLDFGVNDSEAMRIDNNGQLLINTTSTVSNDSVLQVVGNSNTTVSTYKVHTNGNIALLFRNAAGDSKGSIVINADSTAYNTTSDYRLKENVDYTFDATTRLKQLKPARFNWISDETNTLLDGFIAHEVSSVVPEAISGEKDATETYTDENGDEQTRINPQGIDQSKLVPLLTKALQEAITKIETLEARVQTLESE